MPSKPTITFADESFTENQDSSAQVSDPDKAQESPWLGCGCLLVIAVILISVLTMVIQSCGNSSESPVQNTVSVKSDSETTNATSTHPSKNENLTSSGASSMVYVIAVFYCVASVVLLALLISAWAISNKNLKENERLSDENESLTTENATIKSQSAANLQRWRELLARSKPLQTLVQAVEEADRIVDHAKQESERIMLIANRQAEETKWNANETKEKANRLFEEANAAKKKAFGDLEAEKNRLTRIAEAMRNTIKGYGDEYLISANTLLDDIAEEYDYLSAGQNLKHARDLSKEMVKQGKAVVCQRQSSQNLVIVRLVTDAFNSKVDAILTKVKYDNFGKLQQRILDAYTLVNDCGTPFFECHVTQRYLNARLEELRWACATLELKRIEQEEQREIREQMREEEKARREYEKAQREAALEESLLRKELEQTRRMAALESANEAQRKKYEAMLQELEGKLTEAELRNQRAISMAQQTKQGNVYIISNIGSFGESVLKIGMTRRLIPEDRVNELSDASVPFRFDIHAMIFSNDAPALETALHKHFALRQVNKVNHRKEFFHATVSEVRSVIESIGLTHVHWTMKSAAEEYRETQQIERDIETNPDVRDEWLSRQIQLDEIDLHFDEDESETLPTSEATTATSAATVAE